MKSKETSERNIYVLNEMKYICSQQEGINYNESFAPFAKMNYI